MTTAQIVAGWKSGTITSEAYVWKDSLKDWTPLLEVPELRSKLGSVPRKSGFGAGGTTPRPSQSKMNDLFGGLDLSEDAKTSPMPRASVAPRAPQATAAANRNPQEEDALGSRNESSVLFSLDALKAGIDEEDPKTSDDNSDLFGLGGGAGGLGSLGGGMGGMGGMGAYGGALGSNTADLLTAPVQEPPKPIHRAVAATGGVELAPVRKGKGLMVAAGVGVLLLAGGAFALFGGSDDAAAEKVAAAEEGGAAADAERDAMAAKLAEAEAEKKKLSDELAAAEEAKKKLADAEAKKAEETKKAEEEAKAKEEEAKAEEAKKPAGTTATKKPTAPAAAPAASGGGAFNTGAAKTALSSAAAQAKGCKKAGGPTGPGKAVVTFSTSGRVTSATVQGGAYGGTPVGGCVASTFRRATVPAFSGSAVTVSKSFSL